MKNSFFLVIPKRQNDSKRLVEYEAKSLDHWISELPAGNPGLATRLLHDFIIESNTVEMPAELRLDMLERLNPSVSAIEDNLRFRLIKTGFPKEENDHKILSVLVSIEKEFAIGYWIVVKELTQKRLGWLRSKDVTLPIQRCLKLLSNIIISHFIMGMPIPDWVWLDVHSLYRLSVKLNKNTKTLVPDPSRPNLKSSPEQCYKQILLLSLTETTGLMQKEIPLVYGFIETVSSLISLHPKPIAGQPVQYLVLTEEDKPPHFQNQIAKDNDLAVLYIDFSKLYKALKQKLSSSNSIEGRFSSMQLALQNDQPTAELLDYLLQRWSGVELQSLALFSDRLDRYIAIGLASSHALKNPMDASFDPSMEIIAETKSDSLLSCQFEQPGILSIGSLVSFRKAESLSDGRSLGIVNRIIVNKQNPKIHFGIQFLAPLFFAVSYSLPTATKKDDQQKALLYSLTGTEGEKTFIITDSFLLKEGDIVRLQWKGEDLSVALHQRKNIGLGYWQFNCVKIMEKEKQIPAKKGYDFI
ncbi:MAG: hypothetical protein ACXWTP_05510 [Methylosarcina sp.]